MATTRIVCIAGKKGSGKTTLLVALAAEFNRRKRQVATIKHGHHPALIDTEGKDTWRHYNEGSASPVLIESPGHRVLFERTDHESDPETLVARYMAGADIVLVEGFKSAALPTIEVHRTEAHDKPLISEPGKDTGTWIAIVTDADTLRVSCPVFRFNDTAWLFSLSNLAWDNAKVVETRDP